MSTAQVRSSFKCLDKCMLTYATHIFITELLVTYIQMFLTIVIVKIMACTEFTLTRLASMAHFNSKSVLTNNTDYSCIIKAVELV